MPQPMAHKRVGLIVNPIAGIGGRVGLKGSDGAEILVQARNLGATPHAPKRAVEALQRLVQIQPRIELVTYPFEMGEDEARQCGLLPRVLGMIDQHATTAQDTERAAREMLGMGLDLLLFAGGDGTAVNISRTVGDRLPVVGIPAGVKMHSAVFAVNPRAAGDLAVAYLTGTTARVRESEVMDINEEDYRAGRLSARLYGYLRVPVEQDLVQNMKEASRPEEEFALDGIAHVVIERMSRDEVFVIGPGTTTRTIMTRLGLDYSLLGVDVVLNRLLIAKDVNEQRLLALIQGRTSKLVVTPIGGQGFLFGRGNQQLSPAVIRAIGRENLIVVATPGKLGGLKGHSLLVDTDDDSLNALLSGYIKITTGYNEQSVYPVGAPS
jgi:predicted polyphosphate/ATP-dependent NAD kinase